MITFKEILVESTAEQSVKKLASKTIKGYSNSDKNEFISRVEDKSAEELNKMVKGHQKIRSSNKMKWSANPELAWQLQYIQALAKTK